MITLRQETLSALVDPQGAWVHGLFDNSIPVLFPLTLLNDEAGNQKKRGGMHVCLPNFGPGGSSGLMQHGFGRTLTWHVSAQTTHSVTLTLPDPPAPYEHLKATMTYTLAPQQFSAVLILHNDSQIDLRITPGFHPYFALNGAEHSVQINGKPYELTDLAGTAFLHADSITLCTAGRTIYLVQQNLSTWALWTDQRDNYVCVEPTYGGNRFLATQQADEVLAPDEKKIFSCAIIWE